MYVCGLDEAGRGPLCGPVTAGAVILPEEYNHPLYKDSKKLTEKKRRLIAEEIRGSSHPWGIGWASHREIDSMNIHNATLLAMTRAWEDLVRRSGASQLEIILEQGLAILVDGKFVPPIPGFTGEILPVVKGDQLVTAISAASILAKTERDAWLDDWCTENDQDDRYGLRKHKGYPTEFHRKKIAEYGPSEIHRLSFRLPQG